MNRGYPLRKEQVAPDRPRIRREDTRRGGYSARRPNAGRLPRGVIAMQTSANFNAGNSGSGAAFGKRYARPVVRFVDAAFQLGLGAHPAVRGVTLALDAALLVDAVQRGFVPFRADGSTTASSDFRAANGLQLADYSNSSWAYRYGVYSYIGRFGPPGGFSPTYDWTGTAPAQQAQPIYPTFDIAYANRPSNWIAYAITAQVTGYAAGVMSWERLGTGLGTVPLGVRAMPGRPVGLPDVGLMPAPAMKPIPYALIPIARGLPGREAGYGQAASPKPVPLPRLSRPPAGTAERKRMGRLVPFLKGIKMTWHAATEAQDFTDAFLESIPGGKKVKGGLIAKWDFIVANQHRINHWDLAWNLVYNEVEDRIAGKILGKMEKHGVGPGLAGYGQIKAGFWDKKAKQAPLTAPQKAAQRKARLEAEGKSHLKAYRFKKEK